MYLKIGTRLYRKWKNLPNSDPDKVELERFLRVYEEAPLFLVGFSDEDLIVNSTEPEWLDFFRLPYPKIILAYPKATYKPVFGTDHPVSIIIYLAEFNGGYHVEVLVPSEDFSVPQIIQTIINEFNVSTDEAKKVTEIFYNGILFH